MASVALDLNTHIRILEDGQDGKLLVFYRQKEADKDAMVFVCNRMSFWEYERLLFIKDKVVYADVLRSTGFSNFRNFVRGPVFNGVKMEWSTSRH